MALEHLGALSRKQISDYIEYLKKQYDFYLKECTDFASGIPYFSEKFIIENSNINNFNCIDIQYTETSQAKEEIKRLIEELIEKLNIKEDYEWGIYDNEKYKIAAEVYSIINSNGFNDKINFLGDLSEIKNNTQDYIFCNFIFNSVVFPWEMISEIKEKLNKNGKILITDFDCNSIDFLIKFLKENKIEFTKNLIYSDKEGHEKDEDMAFISLEISKDSTNKILETINKKNIPENINFIRIITEEDYRDAEDFDDERYYYSGDYYYIPYGRLKRGLLSEEEIYFLENIYKYNIKDLLEKVENNKLQKKENFYFTEEDYLCIFEYTKDNYEDSSTWKLVKDDDTHEYVSKFIENKQKS